MDTHAPGVPTSQEDADRPELNPETAAMIAIERILADLDKQLPKGANQRAASVRVLAFLAERNRLIGSPGRKPRSQGGA